MGKIKATTLTQKFGFKDKDLYSPTHDEIILKLLDRKIFYKIMKNTGIIKEYFPVSLTIICEHRDENGTCKLVEQETCPYFAPKWRTFHTDKCPRSEKIMNDMNAIWEKQDDCLIDEFKIQAEYVVKNKRDYEIGFIDIRAYLQIEDWREALTYNDSFKLKLSRPPRKIYFEIKTKIDSFGATMRQINMYRQSGAKPLILITCDNRFNSAFENQGVRVIDWTSIQDSLLKEEIRG